MVYYFCDRQSGKSNSNNWLSAWGCFFWYSSYFHIEYILQFAVILWKLYILVIVWALLMFWQLPDLHKVCSDRATECDIKYEMDRVYEELVSRSTGGRLIAVHKTYCRRSLVVVSLWRPNTFQHDYISTDAALFQYNKVKPSVNFHVSCSCLVT